MGDRCYLRMEFREEDQSKFVTEGICWCGNMASSHRTRFTRRPPSPPLSKARLQSWSPAIES